jgi:hypothetical protein
LGREPVITVITNQIIKNPHEKIGSKSECLLVQSTEVGHLAAKLCPPIQRFDAAVTNVGIDILPRTETGESDGLQELQTWIVPIVPMRFDLHCVDVTSLKPQNRIFDMIYRDKPLWCTCAGVLPLGTKTIDKHMKPCVASPISTTLHRRLKRVAAKPR